MICKHCNNKPVIASWKLDALVRNRSFSCSKHFYCVEQANDEENIHFVEDLKKTFQIMILLAINDIA